MSEKTPEQLAAEAQAAEQKKQADKAAADKVKAEKKAEADKLKAQKKADADKAKADAKAKKDAEKAEKEKAAAEAKAKKEAEAKAKAEAKAAAKPAKVQMPEQNGVRRPKPEGLCGKAWAEMDRLSSVLGQPVPIATLLESTNKAGLNEGNVRAEYARWRKFNGVTGRVTLPTPPAAAAATTGSTPPAA
jgi:hypothetical protein